MNELPDFQEKFFHYNVQGYYFLISVCSNYLLCSNHTICGAGLNL